MSLMDEIVENRIIGGIARAFPAPPHRLNRIHEADAELVDLGDGSNRCLAVTTDALAAVGADPLGLMITVTYSPRQDESYLGRLAQGIADACAKLGTFVLGGDTNAGSGLFLSGCAVGVVPRERTICRIGAGPGDKVYLTGPAGLGNIYAFLRLMGSGLGLPAAGYQPAARIAEGKLIRGFAACAMDTSDGVVQTLDTLMRLNRCRFVLYDSWERTVHPLALEVCRSQGLPPWLALAGVHGEFELCFTVDPRREADFRAAAASAGWSPVLIGEAAEGAGVAIRRAGRDIPLDSGFIRNLSARAGSDPKGYIGQLLAYARELGVF